MHSHRLIRLKDLSFASGVLPVTGFCDFLREAAIHCSRTALFNRLAAVRMLRIDNWADSTVGTGFRHNTGQNDTFTAALSRSWSPPEPGQ